MLALRSQLTSYATDGKGATLRGQSEKHFIVALNTPEQENKSMTKEQRSLIREASTKEVDGSGFKSRLDRWIELTYSNPFLDFEHPPILKPGKPYWKPLLPNVLENKPLNSYPHDYRPSH